jgi:hypothetical protein
MKTKSSIRIFETFIILGLALIIIIKGISGTNLYLDGANYLIQIIEKEKFIFDYPHIRYILALPELFTVISSKFLKSFLENKDLINIYQFTSALPSYLLALLLYFKIKRNSKIDALIFLIVQFSIANAGNAFVLSGIFESTLIFSASFFTLRSITKDSSNKDYITLMIFGVLNLFVYESFYIFYSALILQTIVLYKDKRIAKTQLKYITSFWIVLLIISSLNFYHVITSSLNNEAINFYTHSLYGFFRELYLLSYYALLIFVFSLLENEKRTKIAFLICSVFTLFLVYKNVDPRSIMSQSYDIRTIGPFVILAIFFILIFIKTKINQGILKTGFVITMIIQIHLSYLVGKNYFEGRDEVNRFRLQKENCYELTSDDFYKYFVPYFQSVGSIPFHSYLQSLSNKDSKILISSENYEIKCN